MPRRNHRDSYPRTVAEVLDESMPFHRTTIQAVLRFKRSRPWRGSVAERKAKLRRLHQDLCHIYGKQTTLEFGSPGRPCSLGGVHLLALRSTSGPNLPPTTKRSKPIPPG